MSKKGKPPAAQERPAQQAPAQRPPGGQLGVPHPKHRGTKAPGRAGNYGSHKRRTLQQRRAAAQVTCRHCQRTSWNAGRNLCKTCYNRHRDLYPSKLPQRANRGSVPDFFGRAKGTPPPCPAPVGSAEKIAELTRRAALGLELHVPGDDRVDLRSRFPVEVHRARRGRPEQRLRDDDYRAVV